MNSSGNNRRKRKLQDIQIELSDFEKSQSFNNNNVASSVKRRLRLNSI